MEYSEKMFNFAVDKSPAPHRTPLEGTEPQVTLHFYIYGNKMRLTT